MTQTKEAGRAGTRTGFGNVFVGTIDGSEHSATPRHLQASRLSRRYGLTRIIAALVAEHAFRVEARR